MKMFSGFLHKGNANNLSFQRITAKQIPSTSFHSVSACSLLNCQQATRGTLQEYSSKPLIYSIVEHILVFKRWIQAYFYPLKILHLFGFPSWKSSDPKIIRIKTYLFKNFSQKKGSRKFDVNLATSQPVIVTALTITTKPNIINWHSTSQWSSNGWSLFLFQ